MIAIFRSPVTLAKMSGAYIRSCTCSECGSSRRNFIVQMFDDVCSFESSVPVRGLPLGI